MADVQVSLVTAADNSSRLPVITGIVGVPVTATIGAAQVIGLAVPSDTKAMLVDGSASTGVAETMGSLWEAVKITTTGAIEVSGFSVRAKVSAPLTNQTVILRGYIYTDSTGAPGTLVATLGTAVFGNLDVNYAEVQFIGNTVHQPLSATTSYWLVIKQDSAPAGGTILLDSAASGSALHAISANGTSWTTENSKTLWFKVYSSLWTNPQAAIDNGLLFWQVWPYGTASCAAIDSAGGATAATMANGHACPVGQVTHFRARAVGDKLSVVVTS